MVYTGEPWWYTLRNKASGLSLQQTAQGSVIQSTTATQWLVRKRTAQQKGVSMT